MLYSRRVGRACMLWGGQMCHMHLWRAAFTGLDPGGSGSYTASLHGQVLALPVDLAKVFLKVFHSSLY